MWVFLRVYTRSFGTIGGDTAVIKPGEETAAFWGDRGPKRRRSLPWVPKCPQGCSLSRKNIDLHILFWKCCFSYILVSVASRKRPLASCTFAVSDWVFDPRPPIDRWELVPLLRNSTWAIFREWLSSMPLWHGGGSFGSFRTQQELFFVSYISHGLQQSVKKNDTLLMMLACN